MKEKKENNKRGEGKKKRRRSHWSQRPKEKGLVGEADSARIIFPAPKKGGMCGPDRWEGAAKQDRHKRFVPPRISERKREAKRVEQQILKKDLHGRKSCHPANRVSFGTERGTCRMGGTRKIKHPDRPDGPARERGDSDRTNYHRRRRNFPDSSSRGRLKTVPPPPRLNTFDRGRRDYADSGVGKVGDRKKYLRLQREDTFKKGSEGK